MHKKIITNSFFLLLDRGLRLAVSFAVGIFIARFYGPEQFGQLNYVLATASLFGSLSSLGFDDIVPRDMAALDHENISRADMQKTALLMRLLGGMLALSLVLLLIYQEYGFTQIFWIALVLAPYLPIQATDIYEFRLRVEDQFSKIAFSRSLGSLAGSALKCLVIFLGLPITFLAAAMTSEYIITAGAFKLFVRGKAYVKGIFQPVYAKALIQRSWKIILAGTIIMCQVRIEYFLVEKFLGWESLGQYSAALKIFEVIDVVCVILVTVLMPKLASIVSAENLLQYSRRTYLLGIMVYLTLIPAMIILSLIFPYAYGSQYAQAAVLLPWLFLRPFFSMLNSVRGMFLILQNNYWLPAMCSSFGLLASLIIGYKLIPAYGLFGAVATTLSGMFALTILSDLLFNRKNVIAIFTCYKEWHYFAKLVTNRF
ncbi:oligosaccharide flippase family protein [Polynucleobacter sp. KF022]|uniref:oligosaccharide flippase family protein n=1 Tax=Polynucleobacter sp. KF022 TaxID=2982615 RepID=UPI0023779CF8|nr:oligosaccharide flippase family protein [Polynucleobacter sp. KF022]BDT74652.1 hypothetical protein PKF022_03170 [Polynucleobacter sp. KF022]